MAAVRRAPRSADERIDYVHMRMWFVQMACFALVVLALMATLIVGSMSTAGFPCFFAAVVDYTNASAAIDAGVTNPKLGGVVPVLFFESWEVLLYFCTTALILLILAVYMIAGGVIVSRNMRATADAGGAAYVTSMIASPTTVLTGTVSVWLLQTVVVVLAHKLIVLAAAVYMVFLVNFSFFYGYFCGRGVDSKKYAADVAAARRVDPSFHRLVGNARAVMINLLSVVYGMSLVLAALMLEMLLANSFTMRFWHVVVVTLVTTSVLTTLYLLVTEFILARYVHMLVGPHIGLIAGYGMLGTSTHDYMTRFYYAVGPGAEGLRLACQLVLGMFAALTLIAMIVRIARASMYHRRRYTRAYNTTRRVRDSVRERVRRLSGRSGDERDSGDERGDRMPLRRVGGERDDDEYDSAGYADGDRVIYDRTRVAASTLTDDSDWDD